MINEKEAKYSKAIIKTGCWILKSFIPGGSFQGMLQDVFDECVEGVTDKIRGEKNIWELLDDESLRDLKIPEEHFDLVRSSVISIFENNVIDDNVFREQEYETRQVVEYLWNNFRKKKTNIYGYDEEASIKKALDKIIFEMLKLLTENQKFLITLMSKTEKLCNDMKRQDKKTSELRDEMESLKKIINQMEEKKQNEIESYGKLTYDKEDLMNSARLGVFFDDSVSVVKPDDIINYHVVDGQTIVDFDLNPYKKNRRLNPKFMSFVLRYIDKLDLGQYLNENAQFVVKFDNTTDSVGSIEIEFKYSDRNLILQTFVFELVKGEQFLKMPLGEMRSMALSTISEICFVVRPYRMKKIRGTFKISDVRVE